MVGAMRDRCAVEAITEPLPGTAATDHAHLLLEQSGPWGRKAWEESDLPVEVRDTVARTASAAGVRLHLIRRFGRTAAPSRPHLFVAHTRPGSAWLQRTELDDVRQLLDLDLAAVARGERPGLVEAIEPMVLVCTNGRRDACCAELGRPAAKALSLAHPTLTWESNHLGGHRFAPAMLTLPSGFAYGRVDGDSALEVVASTLAGRVLPAFLRGRGSHPQHVQAAEVALLQQLGETGADALRLVDTTPIEGGHEVTFLHGKVLHEVVVERRSGVPSRTSCTDAGPRATTVWVARPL